MKLYRQNNFEAFADVLGFREQSTGFLLLIIAKTTVGFFYKKRGKFKRNHCRISSLLIAKPLTRSNTFWTSFLSRNYLAQTLRLFYIFNSHGGAGSWPILMERLIFKPRLGCIDVDTKSGVFFMAYHSVTTLHLSLT